jgi:endogenous inhibitor of DNA gyrase (YacG/DUF329 family)
MRDLGSWILGEYVVKSEDSEDETKVDILPTDTMVE